MRRLSSTASSKSRSHADLSPTYSRLAGNGILDPCHNSLFITLAGHFLIPLPVMHPSESELKNAVDWIGAAMVTVALFVLLFALTEGNVVGWTRPYICVIIGLSGLLLVAFIFWQLYLENRTMRKPLVKLSIFKNVRSRSCYVHYGLYVTHACSDLELSLIILTAFFSSFFNFLVFATYWWQDWQGLSKIQTTLRFLPTGPAGSEQSILIVRNASANCNPVLAAFMTSQLLSQVKVNYIVMFGIVCCATSSFLFAIPISPYTTYWAFGFPAMVLCVFGADTLFPSLVLFNSHSLPKEDQALGGALINAVGQVGRAICLAIAIAIQVRPFLCTSHLHPQAFARREFHRNISHIPPHQNCAALPTFVDQYCSSNTGCRSRTPSIVRRESCDWERQLAQPCIPQRAEGRNVV